MSQFPRSILKPAAVLIAINVIGLLWIHHDLTAIRPATVLARDVALAPDDIRADRLVAKGGIGGIREVLQEAQMIITWPRRDTIPPPPATRAAS